ncbi:ECF RNA polymerase sigma factor SigE [Microbacterium oxydans]|uniref:ECF RNA polymerase sigma factor SigE n=1 Tax=Microbacterium oxydans TaxID=82380 RepID=A0A0F0L5G0_9MICO|nr:sigma-70 family RNA polymerase sigma factor [Microbacterium oxydans]KJL27565.1 ECF RNA polymerase sigma factor SigE [Microbacterium oxydans]CAH0166308.1 ECF RNA polymerase sigma factor SigE [Microbacterium oxydans]
MSTDSEIIQRSLEHPPAFAQLFDRHSRAINAFASYRIGRHAAEDVLSETFLVAFRRRADFDTGIESAAPWLFGIASRLIRRHRAVEAKHWRSFAAAVTGEEHTSDGGVDEAMARIDAERKVQAMRTRIASLSPRDRETLLLYAWQGLTYEQIGEALGVPVGTVRSRLNRVRRRLDPGRRAQDVAQVIEIVEQGESNERV